MFGTNHVCPCWKWIFPFTLCSFVCHVKISLCWHLSSFLSNDRWICTKIFHTLHFRSTLKQLGVIFSTLLNIDKPIYFAVATTQFCDYINFILRTGKSVHEWIKKIIKISHYYWYLVGGLIGLITDLSFFDTDCQLNISVNLAWCSELINVYRSEKDFWSEWKHHTEMGFFSLLYLRICRAICSGKRRERREEQNKKKKEKTTPCFGTNWLGWSWGIWWPMTDMTFESENFKMSETGESENIPECTTEETSPPCTSSDTEDCEKSSQVII